MGHHQCIHWVSVLGCVAHLKQAPCKRSALACICLCTMRMGTRKGHTRPHSNSVWKGHCACTFSCLSRQYVVLPPGCDTSPPPSLALLLLCPCPRPSSLHYYKVNAEAHKTRRFTSLRHVLCDLWRRMITGCISHADSLISARIQYTTNRRPTVVAPVGSSRLQVAPPHASPIIPRLPSRSQRKTPKNMASFQTPGSAFSVRWCRSERKITPLPSGEW